MISNTVIDLLEENYRLYNRPEFIEPDPLGIPHKFSKLQDIEISGFFAAMLAWGQRVTIINNCRKLMTLMDNAPHAFVVGHSETDLKRFLSFAHRTFNATDLLYFIAFFKDHYSKNSSLEQAFTAHIKPGDVTIENALTGFHHYFFSLENAPARTRKHVSTPGRKSTCKRLNMYLRWMVRTNADGVDLGVWKNISPAQLLCPLDVHVERISRKLGLLKRPQRDWQAVLELTNNLRLIDPADPVRFDIALFGMGLNDVF